LEFENISPSKIHCPENSHLIDLESKPFVEKEFFKNFNKILENKKKVVVYNKKVHVENPVSSLIRYVIFNSKIIFTQ
jgi:hypothetical protein